MPLQLAQKYIDAIRQERERGKNLQSSVKTHLVQADACLSEWDKLVARANALTKDMEGCMVTMDDIQKGLNKVVTALETLDDNLATTEREVAVHKSDLKNLENDYIISKHRLENNYETVMKRWSQPSALSASRQGYRVRAHHNTVQIQAFFGEQHQKIRWLPPFRYPLYQPVQIPMELLVQKQETISQGTTQTANIAKEAQNQSIKRKEKN